MATPKHLSGHQLSVSKSRVSGSGMALYYSHGGESAAAAAGRCHPHPHRLQRSASFKFPFSKIGTLLRTVVYTCWSRKIRRIDLFIGINRVWKFRWVSSVDVWTAGWISAGLKANPANVEKELCWKNDSVVLDVIFGSIQVDSIGVRVDSSECRIVCLVRALDW